MSLKSTYISIEAAAQKLATQPLSTIRLQREQISEHMETLKRSGCVISLVEYSKFFKARAILDGVLARRKGA